MNALITKSSEKGKRPIAYFSTGKNVSYNTFENLVLHNLDKMASIKQKDIRNYQSPLMNKDIQKAITTRTRLKNKFLKIISR